MMSEASFTHDVFLSHSSKDKPVVHAVAERLRADGLRIWFDEWEIRPGDSIPAKVEDGLEQSRVLVLCMSTSAFGSDWAKLESYTFRFRDPLNKERRFIPLRLDDAPIKGSLSQFLYINWHEEDREQAYAKLLEACRPPAKMQVAEAPSARGQIAEKAVHLDYEANISSYAFSASGTRFLTGATDETVRLWDLESRRCLRTLEGHTANIWSVIWSPDQRNALSASDDKTVRLWDVDTGECSRVFEGHTQGVNSVAWHPNHRRVLSGSDDKTVRLWDVDTGRCLRVFKGHEDQVWGTALSADQRRVFSCSSDRTVRLWNAETGRCLRVLEGHTDRLRTLALSADELYALSGGKDGTLRVWDLKTGKCLRVITGHDGYVWALAWSADQRHALSGGADSTVRLWNLATGRCLRTADGHTGFVRSVAWSADQRRAVSGDDVGDIRVWDLSAFATETQSPTSPAITSPPAPEQIQYTNAKVLLVGESGAGKTGLTERLAHDTFTPSYSTSGTWSTQWQMKDLPLQSGWEREIWLWDFGGQADQRLIHQLYVDRTALILLVFNADRDTVLPGLREWQQALSRSVSDSTPTYLVAGRIDVGFRFDRDKVRAFAEQRGYRYFETSANDGRGCMELRNAIQTGIPWGQLERRTSPATWKLLNNEILKLRDEGNVLFTFKELRESLRPRLGAGATFTDTDLETVVGLLDGPGVVKELSFGTYILLRPEWINAYAQAVIRTLRSPRLAT